MKKTVSLILSLLLCLTLFVPASAADRSDPTAPLVTYFETDLGDGFTVEEELVVSANTRSTTITVHRTANVKFNGTLVAVITLYGTFIYNGSTVRVYSKSVTKTLYDGWNYTQQSLTSSGGTITLKGYVSKLLHKYTFTLTLTCDKDGNLS